jgi:hypothetical protein
LQLTLRLKNVFLSVRPIVLSLAFSTIFNSTTFSSRRLAATSHETSEVGWFHEPNIPADLSLERVLPQQIRRMFAHRRDPSLPTDFD